MILDFILNYVQNDLTYCVNKQCAFNFYFWNMFRKRHLLIKNYNNKRTVNNVDNNNFQIIL